MREFFQLIRNYGNQEDGYDDHSTFGVPGPKRKKKEGRRKIRS